MNIYYVFSIESVARCRNETYWPVILYGLQHKRENKQMPSLDSTASMSTLEI